MAGDKSAPRHLRRLLKIAKEAKDDALLGFVHFYFANWYFDASQYEQYQKNLKQAIYALLRSNSYALLARAYNFFAINAQISGVYDVCYSYYMSALRFAQKAGDEAVAGIITHNLANFYSEIDDIRSARKYFRRSIRLIRKNPEDPFYFRNSLIIHINDGESSLKLGDIAAARRALRKTRDILRRHPAANYPDVLLSVHFLAAHLAMEENKREEAATIIGEILSELNEESLLLLEIRDVREFGLALLEHGYTDALGELLAIAAPHIERSDFPSSKRVLAEMEYEYYHRKRDEKKAMEALQRQHRLGLSQRREQEKIYQYSMELIRLVGELREEELRVRRENEHLQSRILTDYLTEIPNRYAFDRELSEAFERAYHGKYTLGVAIMDVDDFKNHNDRYGHQVGDEYLRRVGRVLKAISEEEGFFCARYGGDEFVAVYENKTGEEIRESAARIAEAVRRTVATAGQRKKVLPVTLSQGICNDTPGKYSKPWDYLSAADALLYEVKGREKDSILLGELSTFV